MAAPTILFLDDNEALRSVLARALERDGYQIVEASSAHESRDILRASAAFDLMIIDLEIPGREDAALIAENRRYAAGIPKLYISGYHWDDARHRHDFPAEAAFLSKPFSVAEFRDKVRELIQSRV